MATWSDVPVTDAHADLLRAAGVTADVALLSRTRSATEEDQLPEEFRRYGKDAVPAIVFDHDGTPQLRPDSPIVLSGKPCKYLWPSGRPLVLSHRRVGPNTGPVMIVEGTKQALSAACWAPDDFTVLGMVGCRGWYVGGAPSAELAAVDGRDVYVVLDSDAATNLDVYTAGVKLAEALALEGSNKVLFVRLPGGAKAGLDDILGARPEAGRTKYFERLLTAAKSKPAEAKPKPVRKKEVSGPTVSATSERDLVVVNGDKLDVIDTITSQLIRRWNASRLFNHGGMLSKREPDGMSILDKDRFYDLLAETCITVHKSGEEDSPTYVHAWPDVQSVGATLSRTNRFAQLDQLVSSPFVRPSGTVCASNGYDADTSTYLALADDVDGIDVPEHPTDAQIEHARSLLVDDLLEGFPFPDDGSRANALATLLTPFIRSTVSLSPLAVVDGKEAGSGKNLLADSINLVVNGQRAVPLPYNGDDEEQRKFLTTVFGSGTNIFVFDEAHKISGVTMARVLTSPIYIDRVLGSNKVAKYRNNVTWMALGNQVSVLGDMARRSYRIRLSYEGENPAGRPAEDFKHPDLKKWIKENRRALVTACLTLCRAWFSRGRPAAPCEVRMGSFESWQATMGGILHVAGVKGFLEGMAEWRSESDYERSDWLNHYRWLSSVMGSDNFTTADVVRRMGESGRGVETPHGLDDVKVPGYSRLLGRAYARQDGKWIDGLRIVRLRTVGHGNTNQYRMESASDAMKVGGDAVSPTPAENPSPPQQEILPIQTKDISPDVEQPRQEILPIQTKLDTDRSVDVCETKKQVSTDGELRYLPRALLPAVADIPEPRCPTCENVKRTFGAAGVMYACQRCYPSMFD